VLNEFFWATGKNLSLTEGFMVEEQSSDSHGLPYSKTSAGCCRGP
jgi:hypothetical protein